MKRTLGYVTALLFALLLGGSQAKAMERAATDCSTAFVAHARARLLRDVRTENGVALENVTQDESRLFSSQMYVERICGGHEAIAILWQQFGPKLLTEAVTNVFVEAINMVPTRD